MPNKRPTPEQIIGKLRVVEIALAQGIRTADASAGSQSAGPPLQWTLC